MPDLKPQLSSGIPVRLPIQLVLELKECAAKQQRTVSQEIRYRLLESCSHPESEKDENKQPA